MLNSRLQEIAQKPESPFLYAGVGYGPLFGKSVDAYYLSMGAKENQIEKSLEVVLTENERVRQFGFTATELEREKKDILSMYEKWQKNLTKLSPDHMLMNISEIIWTGVYSGNLERI